MGKMRKSLCLLMSIMLMVSLGACQEPEKAIIPPTTDEVAYLVSTMTLREKIGQMVMLEFRKWQNDGQEETHHKSLSPEVEKIIKDYNIGGVILFSENIDDIEQTVKLNNAIQKSSSNGIPLFIGVDQEGGMICRLKDGVAMPGNMAIGATDNVDYAFDSSSAVGKELRAMGFNMNFAPSLDINSNPQNPVIGIRAFGGNPEIVSKLGISAIHGYQMQGIIPVAKHFPGHGDTTMDSHMVLPTVNKTVEELEQNELKPFKTAIDNGLEVILTSHIQFPTIESTTVISKSTKERINLPATLSHEIITNVLRKKLNFNGVVITDAMDMAAIRDNFGEEEAVKMAINAGVDIIMIPTTLRSTKDISKLEQIYKAIEESIAKGDIKIDKIDDSVRRILNLKQKSGLLQNSQNFDVELAKEIVASKENRELETKISRDAITCLKNEPVGDKLLIPTQTNTKSELAIFAPYENEKTGIEYGIKRGKEQSNLVLGKHNISVYNQISTPTNDHVNKVEQSTQVVIFTNAEGNYNSINWAVSYPRNLIKLCQEKGKPYIIVVEESPYEAALYKDEPAVLLCYSSKGSSELVFSQGKYPKTAFGPNIPAAMDVLLGLSPVKGLLPVDIKTINEEGQITQEICFKTGDGIKTEPK